MSKEYLVDNLSIEDIMEFTDEMLKAERSKKIERKTTNLLKLIPAVAVFALVIGLVNFTGIFNIVANIGGENTITPGAARYEAYNETETTHLETLQKTENDESYDFSAYLFILEQFELDYADLYEVFKDLTELHESSKLFEYLDKMLSQLDLERLDISTGEEFLELFKSFVERERSRENFLDGRYNDDRRAERAEQRRLGETQNENDEFFEIITEDSIIWDFDNRVKMTMPLDKNSGDVTTIELPNAVVINVSYNASVNLNFNRGIPENDFEIVIEANKSIGGDVKIIKHLYGTSSELTISGETVMVLDIDGNIME